MTQTITPGQKRKHLEYIKHACQAIAIAHRDNQLNTPTAELIWLYENMNYKLKTVFNQSEWSIEQAVNEGKTIIAKAHKEAGFSKSWAYN